MPRRILLVLALIVPLVSVGLVAVTPQPAEATVHPPRNCFTYQPHDLRKLDFCIRNHFEGSTVRPHADTHCYARASVGGAWSDHRCQTQTVNSYAVYTYQDGVTTWSGPHTAYDVVSATHHGSAASVGCGYSAASLVNQVSFRTASGTAFTSSPNTQWSAASARPC